VNTLFKFERETDVGWIEPNTIIQGNCLEVMKRIPDGSVDMVLADPPYG